ncbi:hypothetical protein [Metallosphaera hakonensis]|uniref:hypothetical protein n=1 Tax=Metallosphaera hakonensis TaxID=79601 RepID=UPI000A69B9E4|nr:hypothetical protein [Metallosphaera hakonensis]
MSEAKLGILTKAIVQFEEDVKNVKHDTADVAKALILKAQVLSSELEKIAESSFNEAQKSIESERDATITSLREKSNEDKEKLLAQIRQRAEKKFRHCNRRGFESIRGGL